jgi:hypothetical protein
MKVCKTVANDVQDLANNMACGNGCSVLGIEVLNLATVKSTINTMATQCFRWRILYLHSETHRSWSPNSHGRGLGDCIFRCGLVLVERALKMSEPQNRLPQKGFDRTPFILPQPKIHPSRQQSHRCETTTQQLRVIGRIT